VVTRVPATKLPLCNTAPVAALPDSLIWHVQGIGWALNEEYIYDKNGKMDNPGFLDYRCPVASDLPMIEAILVEVPNPRHPFGVRGVGEVPIIPPMAAVGNAIRDAIGLRMTSLPMSPPKIRKALDLANGDD
jgi:CO/xanthine dehydrogenase Mo-binding subunit